MRQIFFEREQNSPGQCGQSKHFQKDTWLKLATPGYFWPAIQDCDFTIERRKACKNAWLNLATSFECQNIHNFLKRFFISDSWLHLAPLGRLRAHVEHVTCDQTRTINKGGKLC